MKCRTSESSYVLLHLHHWRIHKILSILLVRKNLMFLLSFLIHYNFLIINDLCQHRSFSFSDVSMLFSMFRWHKNLLRVFRACRYFCEQPFLTHLFKAGGGSTACDFPDFLGNFCINFVMLLEILENRLLP